MINICDLIFRAKSLPCLAEREGTRCSRFRWCREDDIVDISPRIEIANSRLTSTGFSMQMQCNTTKSPEDGVIQKGVLLSLSFINSVLEDGKT